MSYINNQMKLELDAAEKQEASNKRIVKGNGWMKFNVSAFHEEKGPKFILNGALNTVLILLHNDLINSLTEFPLRIL